jgi:hypothetical protein
MVEAIGALATEQLLSGPGAAGRCGGKNGNAHQLMMKRQEIVNRL